MQRKILLLLVGLLAIGSAAFVGAASAAHKSPRMSSLTLGNSARRQRGARLRPRRRRHALRPVSYPTGGTGTGGGLGSQGSIVLPTATTSSPSTPAATRSRSSRSTATASSCEATVASGGTMPISLTVHDHLLYVLNAGGAGEHHRLHDRHGEA